MKLILTLNWHIRIVSTFSRIITTSHKRSLEKVCKICCWSKTSRKVRQFTLVSSLPIYLHMHNIKWNLHKASLISFGSTDRELQAKVCTQSHTISMIRWRLSNDQNEVSSRHMWAFVVLIRSIQFSSLSSLYLPSRNELFTQQGKSILLIIYFFKYSTSQIVASKHICCSVLAPWDKQFPI